MLRRSATCPVCGTVWRARAVRFCGRCGTPLTAAAGTQDGRDVQRRRRLATAALAGAAAALLTALAAAGGWPAVVGPAPPETEVALPEQAEDASRLPGRTIATLRWQTRPDRLRCEPVGCQAWFLALPEDTPAVVAAGTVVVLDGPDLVAIDATAGHERWTWPVQELLETAYGPVTGVTLAADDRTIVVTSDDRVTAVDVDGTLRWRDRVGGPVWTARPSGDVVLLFGSGHGWGGRYQQVLALDADTGTPRWVRDVHRTHVLDPDLVVVATATGHVEALDPGTGAVLWRRREYLQATVDREGSGLVVVDHHGRQHVDAATGRDVDPGDLLVMPARADDGPLDPRTGERIGQAMIGSTSGPSAQRLERDGEVPAFVPLGDRLAVHWDAAGVEIAGTTADPIRVLGGRDLRIESTDPLVIGARDQFLGVRVADGTPIAATPP